jgi:hypothetical protein
MAGALLNTFSTSDRNLTNIMECLQAIYQGYHKVSLTNMANSSKPAIAAGSKIEINGSFYVFNGEEEITGTPSTGNTWIKLTVSGSSVTAAFTNTVPTWDTQKGGWYESGTNNRYLNFVMYYVSSAYSRKRKLPNGPNLSSHWWDEGVISANISQSGEGSNEFYVYKPLVCQMKFVSTGGIQSGTFFQYGITIGPGHYRITLVGSPECKMLIEIKQNNAWGTVTSITSGDGFVSTGDLYVTGAYDIDNSGDILTVIEEA